MSKALGANRRWWLLLLLTGTLTGCLTLVVLMRSSSAQPAPRRVRPLLAAWTAAKLPEAAPAAPAREPLPSQPVALRVQADAGDTVVHVYPPLLAAGAAGAGASVASMAAAAPVVWMLHGMCMDPKRTCDGWSDAARKGAWLVCPQGNARCGGRSDWAGEPEARARHLDAARAALVERFGDRVAAPGRDVLMGFSRGAFVARDVAYVRPGHFSTLVLIGAAFVPDADKLRASKIEHVLLAAGDFDGARPTMRAASARLAAGGLDARFEGLGPIWHQLPANMADFVSGAMRFSHGAGDGSS